ncbi:MAG: 2,3-diaminopropionate biosynthesis protein SbnB, partial [Acidobacteriota bacterium]|nr:2,3-diaminopropionate biosynthesis protein SbnB [Acidobacteriota bacterium]
MLILRGGEIRQLLDGREGEVMAAVERAYLTHGRGESSLPHSTFLRFPNDDANRIIALPAYLGGGFETAGMKWIASFPGNVRQGMARASAVLILNSARTGLAEAILESSLISARRTAAGAALAAEVLRRGQPTPA